MNIEPIAFFRSMFSSKFGIPRQSGVVEELCGQIVFRPQYRCADALRGLEDFDYLWIIWEFSANRSNDTSHSKWSPTVRPPLLGGNKAMGVFATRSPFRPNAIGLSSVRIERIEYTLHDGPIIHVRGADIMNGTPIYDIKPYVVYSDSHADARSGFVDKNKWKLLKVNFPVELSEKLSAEFLNTLIKVLQNDPRPQYQDNPDKIYGMPFGSYDIRFKVSGDVLYVEDVIDENV